jgi:uncharacterized protein YggE
MKTLVKPIAALSLIALALSACAGSPGATPAAANIAASLQGGGLVAQQQAAQAVSQGIVVVGTGTASAEPEVAQITFGVELRGDDPAQVVADAADKIDQAIAAAEAAGVAAADIRTAGYNLWVENIYDPDRGVPTGEVVYHVSHYVEAKLRDLSQVGPLLADVVGAGANTISGVNFTVEDSAALMEQARTKALEDAAAKAQQIAAQLGVELGQPILVSDVSTNYPVPMGAGYGGGVAMEAAAPDISPGSFSVSASVQIAYEIR